MFGVWFPAATTELTSPLWKKVVSEGKLCSFSQCTTISNDFLYVVQHLPVFPFSYPQWKFKLKKKATNPFECTWKLALIIFILSGLDALWLTLSFEVKSKTSKQKDLWWPKKKIKPLTKLEGNLKSGLIFCLQAFIWWYHKQCWWFYQALGGPGTILLRHTGL